MARDTGARALRAVMEEFMVHAMFELPERAQSGKWVVTPPVVDGEAKLFSPKSKRRRESA